MNISKKNTEAEWFKFPKSKIEFKIRPLRYSVLKPEDIFEAELQQFMYCVVDWKGLNEEDKPFECNDDNKIYLYDFYKDVRSFVLLKTVEYGTKLNKQLKN